MVNVLIADDHGVVRAGLERLIASHARFQVVGTAADGVELMRKLESTRPDVVVLDLTMPATPFPGLLREMKARYPAMGVLVLSMQPEEQFAVRSLREGAGGFLSKDRSPEELLVALDTVLRGETYVSTEVTRQLAHSLLTGRPAVLHDALSDRERQVLRLIGEATTIGEIARRLGLSPKTVSTYRARILKKLALRNNAQLMRYALEHRLTDFSSPLL